MQTADLHAAARRYAAASRSPLPTNGPAVADLPEIERRSKEHKAAKDKAAADLDRALATRGKSPAAQPRAHRTHPPAGADPLGRLMREAPAGTPLPVNVVIFATTTTFKSFTPADLAATIKTVEGSDRARIVDRIRNERPDLLA